MLGFDGAHGGRKGKAVVLFGLLLVILLTGYSSTLAKAIPRQWESSQAERSYTEGLDRYKAKDYSGAIPLLQRALELEPEFDDAESYLGWSLYRIGRYPEATLHFRQVILRQPGRAEAYDGLGWSRFQVNRYNLALAAFRQALALDPRHRDARVGYAFSLFELARYVEALPQLERLIQEGEGTAPSRSLPDVEKVRARLAWALFYLGDYRRAREQFLKGLEAQPDWAGLHNGLAWTFLRLGDRPQALASFRRALELQPDFADALDGLTQAGR